jgi:hypothetical protein
MSQKSYRRVGREIWSRWWFPAMVATRVFEYQRRRREKRAYKRALHKLERRQARQTVWEEWNGADRG